MEKPTTATPGGGQPPPALGYRSTEIPIYTVLEEARARLASGWCRNSSAVDEHGRTVAVEDPQARRFCLVGALRYGARQGGGQQQWTDETSRAFGAAFLYLRERLGEDPSRWNDMPERTQEEVVAFLAEAIACRP